MLVCLLIGSFNNLTIAERYQLRDELTSYSQLQPSVVVYVDDVCDVGLFL